MIVFLLGAQLSFAQWVVGVQKPKTAPSTFQILGGKLPHVLFSRRTSAPAHADLKEPKLLSRIPMFLPEGAPPSADVFEEWVVPESMVPALHLEAASSALPPVAGEVRTLVDQGPSANRICLTILGDGYTAAEKDRFFEDAERTRRGLFESDTFASYRSLFNVYAVFVASHGSGVTDLERKDTAFGLYRSPAGSKRGIMPGNTRALEAAIALAPKTDFPIVLANDDFYGGLGGRYSISTRSVRSGEIVLRHELGHSIGQVGEEYDNGYVYEGANASRVPEFPEWHHWIEGRPQVHEMELLSGNYVWQNLSQGPVNARFTMPAGNAAQGPRWFDGVISYVGWSAPGEVEVLIDNTPVELTGSYSVDRGFLKIQPNRTLAPGRHSIEVRELVHDGDNVLAFATLFAYPGDYDFTTAVGAHATFDADGRESYRPTHDDCLMRDMEKRHFCVVDQENLWAKMLLRISLIEELVATSERVELKTPNLPGLEITWMGPQGEIEAFKNLRVISEGLPPGEYRVRVKFSSPEIRLQLPQTESQRSFSISSTGQRPRAQSEPRPKES